MRKSAQSKKNQNRSADTVRQIEERGVSHIPGARMRLVKEIQEEVLSRAGRCSEVHLEGTTSKDPSPMKVKNLVHGKKRCIVCGFIKSNCEYWRGVSYNPF